ncbi:MAG: hypothetical protein IJ141_03850 [Lachnospiraceae bacterium]|nr:hypothetical protein [Lachnospiraceae bacterium]
MSSTRWFFPYDFDLFWYYIYGYIQLLKNNKNFQEKKLIKTSETLEEAKENANDIVGTSNTLLEIVNGILDISKIEAGKIEIHNSAYNAHELFDGNSKTW